MKELNALLIELENKIPNQEILNPKKIICCWHIEHALLVINLTIESILKSNPENHKRSFNFNRILFFGMNKIPKGKVKAPKAVLPKEDFTADSLKAHVENIRYNVKKLSALTPKHYFKHPFYGAFEIKTHNPFYKTAYSASF